MYNRPPPVLREARPLPPYVIVERLEDQGYEEVGRPRYNGSTYELEATGLSGARVRLVVDAFRGNVIERYALSSARRGPDFGPGRGSTEEGRGWFGNNVRPPVEALGPRRYSNRPAPDDELQDFLDRPGRRLEPRPEMESGFDTAPRVERRPAQPPGSVTVPLDAPGERQAARPEPVSPTIRPEGTAPVPKVDGLNPDGGKNPDAAKPVTPRNERASRPEPNRQFEATRTESSRSKPARPGSPQEGNTAVSPPAPAPAVTPPTSPPDEKLAVTAEKPANPVEIARPDKPVRVIQGVTPMNPGAAAPSQ